MISSPQITVTNPDTNFPYLNTTTRSFFDKPEGWQKVAEPSSPGALKFDAGKPPLHLLSRTALEETAKVMDFGQHKYAAHNWRKGFAWSRPLSAAQRHILAFQDGEDKDPETGLSHLAHAMCCIMFLLEFEKTHKHLDDRFKPTDK